MGMQWTKEQREVIDLRDCDILVSAAAGSGKTAVLVERILSMLTDEAQPVDIDRLLIVTFTNAAAGEMRERIREAVERRLAQEDLGAAQEEHLQRQTALLQNAQITTIHSFCQYVIRNYFHTIDLEPDFRIADEGEQKLMQNDCLQELIEDAYALGSAEFLHMADCFAPGRDDRELERLILQLYHFSMSAPWSKEWLEGCARAYEIERMEDMAKAPWMAKLCELLQRSLADVRERMTEALGLCQEDGGPYMYEAAVRDDLQRIGGALAAEDYLQYSEAFLHMGGWTRLSGKKDERVSEEARARVKALREEYKKTVDELTEEYFYAPAETMLFHMQQAAPALRELLRLTCEFSDRYAQQKRKKNLMDFDDLEHFALDILVHREQGRTERTAVAQELSSYYHEIMIDEYQDSNLVQELILTAISKQDEGQNNRFMVGDVKQSIYRFRLARPELFMEKYHAYQSAAGKERRIDLHKNFRSRALVLDSVNFLFEQLMAEDLGGVVYDEAAALYPGAQFAEGADEERLCTEVLLVEADKAAENEESARRLEARAIGERIREMTGSVTVWDKEAGSYRMARYGDIVVLLRTISGWADVFAGVFEEMGIPAYTGSRTGYFSATEVQTVLALLKLIDNPRQEIPMTAVLYSPIVGLSGEELAAIRSRHPKEPFYEACIQEESLRGFFEMLDGFRSRAVYLPMHELLWEILETTGYGDYAAAMPGGEQRKANLDMLVEKAMEFETGSYRGLYNFVRYIENLHKYDVDFGEAGIGGAEDTVRILSIHKSKGLEFPIVVVGGMGKLLNQSDARSALVLHADLGAGCDHTDPVLRTRNQTLLKKLMKRQIRQENLGEELRVLYVALTRAKEKLLLAGTVTKLEDRLEAWAHEAKRRGKVLGFTARSDAKCYWDWVIPALMRNQCFQALLDSCGIPQERQYGLYERELHTCVRVIGADELTAQEKEHQARAGMTKEELLWLPEDAVFDEAAGGRIARELGYRYPYEANFVIPAKVSVSELKKLHQEETTDESYKLYEEATPVPLIPEFLKREASVSGAARGTVYHKFMERLDYAYVREKGVRAMLERLIEENQLPAEETAWIDEDKIRRFLDDPLSQRMGRAQAEGRLFCEQQFVLSVNAQEMNTSWDALESVLVQGIIDAYFIEEEEIVLVDYKTDFVKMQEASSLYEKYRVQLDYYEKALERLTGRRVKEKLIYSFCLNTALSGTEDDKS